jgi:hypothetical protein
MLMAFIMFMLFSIGFSMGFVSGMIWHSPKLNAPAQNYIDNERYYSEDE